ncbi:GAF domain-containing protein [Kribbella sp. VKM Ac-2571]|uniref:GAF and ANTAR domain-containing protein n=1 Tax=Kribbella sp. VKM Ac-2571 TaxID=2512222 RepID=UPI0010F315A3|nr:GAF and ANTAR domain-containing protein [Kribbella sp. VKM Ac-2571]TDO66866.1 GAF domain-containing protein [Kribbella sp. VKM Ac-2571]
MDDRADDKGDAPLVDALSSLHSLLLGAPGLEELLAKLVDVAAKIVEPPASCGITTRYDGQPQTIVSSDARAAWIDEQQYSLREGPCLDALASDAPVDVADYLDENRWPQYVDAARKAGVKASLALPLIVDGQTIGAMNLYGYERPDTFSEADRERATAYAEQAATTLAFAARAVRQSELGEQLEQALASRSVIDQALGLLMGQEKCDARTAFELLRRHSQNHNRKLRDVAAALIARHTGRPAVDSRAFESGARGGDTRT